MKIGQFAFLAIVSLLLCACDRKPPDQPNNIAHPALWSVSDADTTIFVFGSIHSLPKNLDWKGGAIGQAIDQSDELVLEITGVDQTGVSEIFRKIAADEPPGPTVTQRVREQLRVPLTQLIRQSGQSRIKLDQMESWAVALSLANALVADSDINTGYGVDAQLDAKFRVDNKPVSGLESPQSQLRIFDLLPEDAQRRLLEAVVESVPDAKERTGNLIAAWANGDVAALARITGDELEAIRGLRKPLLVDRNRQWVKWIGKRMDQPGTVFFAVGASHLVGEDSLLEMLTDSGFRVKRVQ